MDEPFTLRAPPSITRPTAYHFRFAREGWAIFTLNDETCEFSIQSDWGCYGCRWHQNGLGKRTLTEFIATAGSHYLIGKLQLGTQSKNLDDIVDVDATLRAVRQEICEQRRGGGITRAEARDLWELADDWMGTDFDYAACDVELAAFLEHAPQYVKKQPTGWCLVLRDQLLPFFCGWLRENVVKREEVAHG